MSEMEIRGIRETITEQIRAQIILGKLAPGQRLNEVELSEMFNVSRSPLREALLILEREDLVINVPRKGTYVTSLSEENMRMIYQVMEMVELYAIDQLRVKEITRIPEMIAAANTCTMVQAPSLKKDPEDLLRYRKHLASFHTKLVESLNNPQLILFYKRACANLARYQYLQLLTKGVGKEMIQDHKRIISSIEKKAYGQAMNLLKAHIKKSFEYKISILKEFLENPGHETGGFGKSKRIGTIHPQTAKMKSIRR